MQTIVLNPLKCSGAILATWLMLSRSAMGQAPPEESAVLQQVLARLDRIEQQNQELTGEIRALRQELAASQGHQATSAGSAPGTSSPSNGALAEDLAEKLDVQERRLEEQAQTKVESSQHLPIRITGMALFNAFLNSGRPDSGSVVPVTAPLGGDGLSGGATLRQTILGLEFRGPEVAGGGKVRGFLNMDFFAGSGDAFNNLLHIRTAGIEIDWANTSVMVGQDKPLISPREPASLVQVGVSPLTGAGNLWIWQPQARVEQRFRLGDHTRFRAQAGIFQTAEGYGYVPPSGYSPSFQNARPAAQGRFSLVHDLDDERRIEIGSGFDASDTHIAGASVPSRVFAVDWFANPWRKLEFSGSFFRGKNVSNLGGIGSGFTIVSYGNVIPVHADGGWAQMSLLATRRLTFNFFGGEQDNRNRDLTYLGIAVNAAYGANLMYRFAPNVILSLETGQVRTSYLGEATRLSNHHGLGIAYLF